MTGDYKWNPEWKTCWLTVEEASKHFSVSKTTIYGWIKKDLIRTKTSRFGNAYIVDVNSINKS
tara:strand:- start:352 stop:540 length:189 start_codon:yes stop_codon:yes gene_type:complete